MPSAQPLPALPPPSNAARHWHLQVHTHQQVALFADWRCARAAAACLSRSGHWHGTRLLCWVLLPDHWSALLQADQPALLLHRAGSACQAAAEAVNRARGRGGTVWQPQPTLTPLAAPNNHRHFARALVAAPVRAGLAAHVGAYPYWDAVWLPREAGGTAVPGITAMTRRAG
ncbi:hypothetical protein VDS41_20690 [Xanthomonas campestris pv. campestris]|nr:hypothetical protein [Xanthomonas campestris]MEB2233858.1 hypothetical protein [Xanthomonas campestris pv. campestris]